MELEWVLPEMPMASSASRIGLLFTSSSRARSLILTLFIRPFSFPYPSRLACHTSLVGSGNRVLGFIISEFFEIAAKLAIRGRLSHPGSVRISHGHARRSRWFRRRPPGFRRPGCDGVVVEFDRFFAAVGVV